MGWGFGPSLTVQDMRGNGKMASGTDKEPWPSQTAVDMWVHGKMMFPTDKGK